MNLVEGSTTSSTGTASTDAASPRTRVILVAHRAGNAASEVRPALAADMIEVDVHHFRNRLEVRHAKVLWPLAARWERWHFVPRHTPRPTLDEILCHAEWETHLWVDLKGFGRRLPEKVLDAVGHRPQTTLSSRAWWILPAPGRHRNVRVVHSIGSRLQLWTLRARGKRSLEAVAIDQRLVDEDTMRRIRGVASTVFVWGVRDVDQALALVAKGADGLIIDGMATLVEIRSRLESAVEGPNP
jgi:glycerophosphoryl diester phosphodiesterase